MYVYKNMRSRTYYFIRINISNGINFMIIALNRPKRKLTHKTK